MAPGYRLAEPERKGFLAATFCPPPAATQQSPIEVPASKSPAEPRRHWPSHCQASAGEKRDRSLEEVRKEGGGGRRQERKGILGSCIHDLRTATKDPELTFISDESLPDISLLISISATLTIIVSKRCRACTPEGKEENKQAMARIIQGFLEKIVAVAHEKGVYAAFKGRGVDVQGKEENKQAMARIIQGFLEKIVAVAHEKGVYAAFKGRGVDVQGVSKMQSLVSTEEKTRPEEVCATECQWLLHGTGGRGQLGGTPPVGRAGSRDPEGIPSRKEKTPENKANYEEFELPTAEQGF
ncbi:unnamed protein product, partial [Notodromas monacha]